MTRARRLASRSHNLLALSAVLAAALALFRGALFFGEQFVDRDLLAYYIPAKSLVRRLTSESSGLPLWNPYFATGQPFAANPEHAIFHPITWLFLVLPFEWAMRLQVILPVVLAFFSMRFFLRVLPTGRRGALVGGLGFAFGGYLLSMTNLLPILYAVPALPLVLAFVLRGFRSGRPRDVALLALAFGLLCLAAEPSTLLMTPALVLAVLVFEVLRRKRVGRSPRAYLVRALAPAGGLALGLAIGSAALLPAMRLASKTDRAKGLGEVAASYWSMPFARPLELLWPYAFGRVERGRQGFAGAALYPDKEAPFVFSLYHGLLVAFGAAAALASRALRRRPERLVWVFLAVAGLIAASGAHTPVWGLLRRAPLLSGLRFPEKFVLLTSFSVLVLAGLGTDGLLRRMGRWRSRFPRSLVAGLFAATVGLLFSARQIGLLVLGSSAATQAHEDATLDIALLIVVALGYSVALAARFPRRIQEPLLVMVFAFDLLSSGVRLARTEALPTSPPVPSIREILAGHGRGPIFHHAAWVLEGQTVLPRLVFPPLPALWGVPTAFENDFDLTELRWSSHATRLFRAVLRHDQATGIALLERRGVTGLVKLLPGVDARVVETSRGAPLAEVWWLRSPQPFAFAAGSVARVDGERGWLEAVLGLGAAASRTVCLDTRDPMSAEPGGLRVPPAPGPATVEVIERRPSRIELFVTRTGEGDAPSLIAINQTWDEFWSATLDGERTKVLRVDLSLSAVVVPKGRSVLVLTYDDPWIRRGIGLALGGVLVAIVLFSWRRQGAKGSAPGFGNAGSEITNRAPESEVARST